MGSISISSFETSSSRRRKWSYLTKEVLAPLWIDSYEKSALLILGPSVFSCSLGNSYFLAKCKQYLYLDADPLLIPFFRLAFQEVRLWMTLKFISRLAFLEPVIRESNPLRMKEEKEVKAKRKEVTRLMILALTKERDLRIVWLWIIFVPIRGIGMKGLRKSKKWISTTRSYHYWRMEKHLIEPWLRLT